MTRIALERALDAFIDALFDLAPDAYRACLAEAMARGLGVAFIDARAAHVAFDCAQIDGTYVHPVDVRTLQSVEFDYVVGGNTYTVRAGGTPSGFSFALFLGADEKHVDDVARREQVGRSRLADELSLAVLAKFAPGATWDDVATAIGEARAA
jgi:hypothetical protein